MEENGIATKKEEHHVLRMIQISKSKEKENGPKYEKEKTERTKEKKGNIFDDTRFHRKVEHVKLRIELRKYQDM